METRKTVLVVDDDPAMAKVTVRVLKTEYNVDTVPSGQAALEALGAKHYDAVVSDVDMVGINGPELLRRIRAQASPLADRFMFCTGSIALQDLVSLRVPVLSKPYDPKDLRSLVYALTT